MPNDKPAQPTTPVRLHDQAGELPMLRDAVIRAHGLATGHYVQTAEQRLRTIGRILDAAINASPACAGLLGRGGAEAHRDILDGTGSLDR